MSAAVGVFHVIARDVGIDLGRDDVGMAEKCLYAAEIRAAA